MDKDTELSYVGGGNYIDANDIRHRQTGDGNFAGVMPIKGNALKNTIGGYTSGQKRYRFYIDISDIVSGELSSHDANLFISFVYSGTGAIPATYGGSVTYAGTSISGVVSTIQSSITSAVSPLTGIAFSVAPPGGYTGNTAYFDMYWSGNDFTLAIENTQGTYANIYLLDEYLTDSGNFVVVGSEQIDNDIFLFLAGDDLSDGIRSVISEIGVLYSTDNDSTFSYVRLLRSKKLGFSPTRKIEVQSEKTTDQISFYFTDDLNKPRVVYLKYANKRTADGLLYPQGGRYELENIDTETALFSPAPSAYLEDIEVLDGAGSLTAGNKRYTGRFLSEDLVSTDFLYPTNPVNIFNAEFNKPHLITGNLSTVITAKAVRLNVKNIPKNIYKYFELIVIEYAGETFTTKIVQRFSIPADTTQITVEHTERGQENIQLGPNELVAITQKYIAAKTIRLFDNRMTMSNLVEQSDLDLSVWTQTFKHEIKRKQIPFIGYLDDPKAQNISFNLNEYINPQNVLENTSYMYNDTYRFGLQVQWKDTGKWSSPYWVDDIRIDTSTSNTIGGTSRRIAPSFTDANVTESFANGNDVYVYYVQFSNIDLNTVISGRKIKDLISSFRFVRAERIPEVLATGLFFMGAAYTNSSPQIVPYFNTISSLVRQNFPNSMVETRYVAEMGMSSQNLTAYNYSNYLFFYSPDHYFNKAGSEYEFLASDKIKLLGVPGTVNLITIMANATYNGTYLELDGNTGTPANNGFFDFPITHHTFLDDGQEKTLDGNLVWAGAVSNNGSGDVSVEKRCRAVNVFKTATLMSSYSEWAAAGRNTKDNGYFYGQLFRDLGAHKKYPINKELTIYQSTGHQYILGEGITAPISQGVFGGDVFNQKTYMLLRMGEKLDSGVAGGAGYLTALYSQNVFNTQMFNYTEWDNTETGSGFAFPQYTDKSITSSPDTTTYVFPGVSGPIFETTQGTIGTGLARYLEQWLAVSNNNTYEKSYNFKDGTIVEQGFDTNKAVISDLPTRMTWSAKKILNSPIDGYRLFKPLDFADLDLTFGEIAHHEVINNTLYTFQERSFQRQYFRDASLVGAQEGTDVVVGSGSIMGSPGVELSAIGTSKKWSIIKGKTTQGKDAVYWYNDRFQKIMRFGQDGVRVISDKGLVSYLTNNGKYVSNEFHPLSGKGVHGVWNDKFGEAIFTFKYNTSDKFTIVYDEIKNGFICFHSYYPNIFIPYNNSFFSTNPSSPNTLWLHDAGSEATYYGTAVDPTIQMVMNYEPNTIKIFEAMQILCENAPSNSVLPHTIYLATKNHTSFLDASDCEYREDLYYSTIKNHEVTPGVNDADTSRLWGRWLKIKFNLRSSSGGQRLLNIISKFRVSPRLYNQ
jgi:hypothetical protein